MTFRTLTIYSNSVLIIIVILTINVIIDCGRPRYMLESNRVHYGQEIVNQENVQYDDRFRKQAIEICPESKLWRPAVWEGYGTTDFPWSGGYVPRSVKEMYRFKTFISDRLGEPVQDVKVFCYQYQLGVWLPAILKIRIDLQNGARKIAIAKVLMPQKTPDSKLLSLKVLEPPYDENLDNFH